MNVYDTKNKNYRVDYDIKHLSRTSSMYGILTHKTAHFNSLTAAHEFACNMKGKKTDKFEVVGFPIIEKVAS